MVLGPWTLFTELGIRLLLAFSFCGPVSSSGLQACVFYVPGILLVWVGVGFDGCFYSSLFPSLYSSY
jgi:hypothetical protein